jgi:hypothetical protein
MRAARKTAAAAARSVAAIIGVLLLLRQSLTLEIEKGYRQFIQINRIFYVRIA